MADDQGLVRRLGRFDSVMLTVGSVIGTGIFITTSDMARVLPQPRLILLVWALGGLFTLTGALTYAELGALYPRAGGMYHYLKEAYSPLWGFLYGWACFLVIMSGGIAALAVAFGEYLGSFLPYFSTSHVLLRVPLGMVGDWTLSGGQVAATLAIGVLTLVNYFGLREGATLQNALALFRIGSIVGFVVLGLAVERQVTDATATSGNGSGLFAAFGIAMIAALWTYDGWYGPTFSAGEMIDPGRTLPRGLVWGTVLVTTLYLLINFVYLRTLTIAEIAASSRVAETAAAALFGLSGARIMSAAVLVSTFGCLSATILYSARIYLPMAEDRLFFRGLARVHPKHRTPGRSLWAQSLWAIVLTLSGTYEQLYTYVVFVAILFHVAVAASIFILRRRHAELERPYRVWGYPWTPLLFIVAAVALTLNTLIEKPLESMAGLGLLVLGLPAYVWWRKRAEPTRPDDPR